MNNIFNISDLLSNDDFVDWVNNPSINNSRKWLELIKESEGNRKKIEEAKQIVLSFNSYVDYSSDEEISDEFIASKWQDIRDKTHVETSQNNWLKYAAVIVAAIAVFGSVFQTQFSNSATEDINTFENITLTLGNGDVVEINEERDAVISSEDGGVIKLHEGTLSLEKPAIASNINWQSIKVPKGRKLSIALSDGTIVNLNSDTELTYPDVFEGDNRIVKLKGEAYFEVAHNKEMPFVVENNSQNVTVLGTKFNISCYDDDNNIKTTLTEGSVKIESKLNESSVVLLPGEQGVLSKNNAQLLKSKVDTKRAISWLDEVLYFNNEEIDVLSKKIERWYNVKIVFNNDDIKRVHFTGVIRKDKSIDHILNLIEKTSNIKIVRENNEIFFN